MDVDIDLMCMDKLDSNHKELCREHCLAGAGTMLLEFAALSR